MDALSRDTDGGNDMEELRRPCSHRGTPAVLKSPLPTVHGAVDFCICRECRRFWIERDGWLMSQRETMSILRDFPTDALESFAR